MKTEAQTLATNNAIISQLNLKHGEGRDIQVYGKVMIRVAAIGKYYFVCNAEELSRAEFTNYLKRIAGGRYAPEEIKGLLGTLDFEAFKSRVLEIANA